MRKIISLAVALFCLCGVVSGNNADTLLSKETIVYTFQIREDIMPAVVRLTSKCLAEAQEQRADYVLIDMNTYGGLVDAADSIRTMLLNCPVPVMTFVNNQAISAGALIAIASDSIYMRPGANIGAATVVDQQGVPMPDKYQSFMRSMMRSTAESHGKVETAENGRTVLKWRRDPQMAQAMVDPSVVIEGLVDSTKVLTFTADEALRYGYCEGRASSVEEVLSQAGIEDYTIVEYRKTAMDKLMGFLTNPMIQGLFIMLIIGGIFFELQTPGVGFPLVAALLGAVLYFAPLYVEGLAANWELIVFILGIILIIVEIFVTPGFGFIGIAGIVAVIAGLTFALIDTSLLKHIPTGELSVGIILEPLGVVIISISVAAGLSIWLSNKFLKGRSHLRNKIVLVSDMLPEEGYVSHKLDKGLIGREAVTATTLRPSGKVLIDGKYYEAAGDNAVFVEKGVAVVVVREENGVLYCRIAA